MEEQMALQNILFIPVKVCIKALNDIFNAVTLVSDSVSVDKGICVCQNNDDPLCCERVV